MRPDEPDLVPGVAWYRRDQWNRLREVAVDHAELEDTYDEWLKIAQTAMLDLGREGVRVQRIEIDVEELVRWCRQNNRAVDAAARSEFVVTKLREEHKASGGETV